MADKKEKKEEKGDLESKVDAIKKEKKEKKGDFESKVDAIKKEKKEKKGDFESKVDAISARLRIVEKFLKAFGISIDLDQDGKIGSTRIALIMAVVIFCILCGSAFAITLVDWTTGSSGGVGGTANITDNGSTAVLNIDVVNTTGTTTNNNLSVTDDAMVGDDLAVGGLVTITPTALTVTNGQAVTVADSVYYVTSQGGADGTTNTVTLADPVTTGKTVLFIINDASSNLMGLADSGNLKLAGAANMGDDDTISLIATATNVWVETSRTDN